MSDSERLRRRRQLTWRYRLFFAICCMAAAYNWLTLLPALWWGEFNRYAVGLNNPTSFVELVCGILNLQDEVPLKTHRRSERAEKSKCA